MSFDHIFIKMSFCRESSDFILVLLIVLLSVKFSNCNKDSLKEQNHEFGERYDKTNAKLFGSETQYTMEGRAGGVEPTNLGTIFSQFWNSLYLNRGFNSSFVLLLPLFTVTIPGYGRGLEHQTPLSALNVGLSVNTTVLKTFCKKYLRNYRKFIHIWNNSVRKYSLMGSGTLSRLSF